MVVIGRRGRQRQSVDSPSEPAAGDAARIGLGLQVVLAAAGPALWGLIAGWWTPRGPLTVLQALAAMVVGLATGALSGMALRSRWAMLLAPVLFVAVVELARLGAVGPTVDAPAASTYGMFALVVGRGYHGLVALVPMVVGAALGAGVARRLAANQDERRKSTFGQYLRGAVAGVVMVLIAASVARPATTKPILDASGATVPGSIAELTSVNAGGKDLGLMIRGTSVENPVVLFLAGGPGGSERGAMRRHLESLEKTFTVATWDQRGTGTSYAALDPIDTLTLEGQIADTIEVTDYLRKRFDKDQIYLLGQSWGSVLGVLTVQKSPDRYVAFVGTGQMVSPLDTDRIFYEDTLAWAKQSGNDGLAQKLRSIGPPPYSEMLNYETALSYEHEVYPYDHSGNSEGSGGFSENFLVSEYALMDQVHMLGAFMDTFAVLYPQIQQIDFRQSATSFDIPVFFVQGAHEADGRIEPFDEWYRMLDAPSKDLVVLDTSGHRPLFEQPEEFVEYMNETVLKRRVPS